MILLGAAEVVWVTYLAFTQQQVVRIFHVRLAALGLGGFAIALCVAAGIAVLRGGRWTAVLGVACATVLLFLATFGRLTPALDTSGLLGSGQRPLLVAAPGAVAAGFAAWVQLRRDRAARKYLQIAGGVLLATAAVVLARTVLHVLTWDSSTLATQSRAIIVILDTGETVGLLGAGLASRSGRVRATLVLATIACTLLLCDAYGNVVMAASGQAFAAAIFYLVVGEIPSIIVCLLAVRSAQAALTATAQVAVA